MRKNIFNPFYLLLLTTAFLLSVNVVKAAGTLCPHELDGVNCGTDGYNIAGTCVLVTTIDGFDATCKIEDLNKSQSCTSATKSCVCKSGYEQDPEHPLLCRALCPSGQLYCPHDDDPDTAETCTTKDYGPAVGIQSSGAPGTCSTLGKTVADYCTGVCTVNCNAGYVDYNGVCVIPTDVVWDDPSFYGKAGSIWQILGGGGSSQWTTSGNDIYNNNTGVVGIGGTPPGPPLKAYASLQIKKEIDPILVIEDQGNFVGYLAANGLSNADKFIIGSEKDIVFKTGVNFTNGPIATGTEIVYMTSTGNVGIGTITPGYKLHVVNEFSSTNTVENVLAIERQTTGTPANGIGGAIEFRTERQPGTIQSNTGRIMSILQTGANSTGDRHSLAFETRNDDTFVEGLRIRYDGNVGIGITEPGQKLVVNGGYIESIGDGGGLRLGANNWGDPGATYGSVITDDTTYKALMIVGNEVSGNSGKGREVKVWDYLNVQGPLNSLGAISVDGNTVIDDGGGWHRSYGSTGWYNGTYGGGWYMNDTSWIRAYNNKGVYTTGTISVGDFICSNCIEAGDLAADSVGYAELAANAVYSSNISNNSITSDDLSDSAIDISPNDQCSKVVSSTGPTGWQDADCSNTGGPWDFCVLMRTEGPGGCRILYDGSRDRWVIAAYRNGAAKQECGGRCLNW